jgi:predicted nucleic acid-binding protein
MYLDTSILAKQYVREPGADDVREFLARIDQEASCSEFTRMEIAATFHRKLPEGEITQAQFDFLKVQFADDVSKGRIRWLPLNETIIDRVESLFLALPANIFLRTGDAIHLVTAADAGFKEIYSSDRHLLAAASLFELKGVNPLAE